MNSNTLDSFEVNLTINNVSEIYLSEDIKITQDVLVLILVLSIMVAMGADICWQQILEHFRRPFGPIIGLFCQFIIMPLIGFTFNKIFMFESGIATGLLIISCCPGGAISNAFAYYLDGDVSLSVTMTTISTVLALGMMPLNIWIYAIRSEANKLVIPYGSMALSLVIITSPVLIGMAIRWKLPKISPYITKGCSSLGFIALAIITVLEFISFRSAFLRLSWKLIFTSAFMPVTGTVLGYSIAFFCKRSNSVCKTIAIESGIQNAAVAYSIILLSFDIRKNITILFMPLFYGTTQAIFCSLLCLIYGILMRLKKQQSPEQEINKAVENKENTSL